MLLYIFLLAFGRFGATIHNNLRRRIAHASGVLNLVTGGFGGMLVAALVWLLNYQRLRWAAFQGLQALAFQAAALLVAIGAVLLGVLVIMPAPGR
jgi:uncharacterized Tic20 family protein